MSRIKSVAFTASSLLAVGSTRGRTKVSCNDFFAGG